MSANVTPFWITTVATAPSAGSTTGLVFSSVTGAPPTPFRAVIRRPGLYPTTTTAEVIEVTTLAGTTVTSGTRDVLSTGGITIAAGYEVYQYMGDFMHRAYSRRMVDDPSDRSAIQDAINDISTRGGGEVVLPAGSFTLDDSTPIEMKAGVMLRGAGKHATTLNAPTVTTGTVTMTIASPAVITWGSHGLSTGSIVTFSTTGALPTGISAGVTYWITAVSASTFKVSTSLANCNAGIFVNTSGVQSGTHTCTPHYLMFYTPNSYSENYTNTGVGAAALTANGTMGNTTVTIGSTTGWTAGDYALISVTAAGNITQVVRIRSVDSATVMSLYEPLSDTFNTARGAYIMRMTNTMANAGIKDLKLVGTNVTTVAFGLWLEQLVEGCEIDIASADWTGDTTNAAAIEIKASHKFKLKADDTGSGSATYAAIQLHYVSQSTFEVDAYNSASVGARFDGCHQNTITHVHATDCVARGFKLGSSAHNIIGTVHVRYARGTGGNGRGCVLFFSSHHNAIANVIASNCAEIGLWIEAGSSATNPDSAFSDDYNTIGSIICEGGGTCDIYVGANAVNNTIGSAVYDTIIDLSTHGLTIGQSAKAGAVHNLYAQTASGVVSNSTSELSLITNGGGGTGTLTLPAYRITKSKSYRLGVTGIVTTTGAGPTLRIRVKLGATTVLDTTAVATPAGITDAVFELVVIFTCRTAGATGTIFAEGYLSCMQNGAFQAPSILPMRNNATTTIDTTASNLLDVTAQWGTADAANLIAVATCNLEVIQ